MRETSTTKATNGVPVDHLNEALACGKDQVSNIDNKNAAHTPLRTAGLCCTKYSHPSFTMCPHHLFNALHNTWGRGTGTKARAGSNWAESRCALFFLRVSVLGGLRIRGHLPHLRHGTCHTSPEAPDKLLERPKTNPCPACPACPTCSTWLTCPPLPS